MTESVFQQVFDELEPEAVRAVVKRGKEWGYGNMICRLRIAWALELYEVYGDDLNLAMVSAGLEAAERAEFDGQTDEQILATLRQRVFADD